MPRLLRKRRRAEAGTVDDPVPVEKGARVLRKKRHAVAEGVGAGRPTPKLKKRSCVTTTSGLPALLSETAAPAADEQAGTGTSTRKHEELLVGQNPLELHLKSLPMGSTAKSLRSFFADANPVHVGINQHRGEAVVRLATTRSADMCRQRWDAYTAAFDSKMFNDHKANAKYSRQRGTNATDPTPKRARTSAGASASADFDAAAGEHDPAAAGAAAVADAAANIHAAHEVHVRFLPRSVTKEKVLQVFSKLNPKAVRLRQDAATQRFTGCAFLTFGTEAEAIRCVREFDGYRFGTRLLKVAPARSNPQLKPGSDGPPKQLKADPAECELRVKRLTQQIASLAAKRQLAGALTVFNEMVDEELSPNVHTYAALINAHVNSADLAGAARMFEKMQSSGCPVNVVVYTALLKGHCRVGDIAAARLLLDRMAQAVPPVLPDLRAVNTFLRGCSRVGDVSAASEVFAKMQADWQLIPDSAACKFMVRLLSQGLRTDAARDILQKHEMQGPSDKSLVLRVTDEEPAERWSPCLFWAKGRCKRGAKCKFYHDPEVKQNKSRKTTLEYLDAVAAMYVDVSHSAALFGRWEDCQSALCRAADACRASQGSAGQAATVADDGAVESCVAEDGSAAHHEASRRLLELDISRIRTFADRRVAADILASFGRAFIFNVGSPARLMGKRGRLSEQLFEALRVPFGLEESALAGHLHLQDLKRRFRRCVSKSGKLQWRSVFGHSRSRLPVKLEIGAGTGEWAVAQARAEEGIANWVAMELMHDRVYSIFSRITLEAVSNLCVLGGDAGKILPRRIEEGTVAHVFVNFPEPPHVSGSEAAESALHLLTGSFFRHIHNALSPHGRVTILSDNHRYCQTLARTVAGLEDGKRPLFESMSALPEGTKVANDGHEDIGGVRLHHGIPGPDNGHIVKVVSHFDKLWESTQRTQRYFLSLRKSKG